MNWKLVFSTETNRGVAFNRSATDNEFEVNLPASQCGWFNQTPARYEYVDGVFGEFAGWDAEVQNQEVQSALTTKLAQIDALVQGKQSEDFPFQGAMFYSDPDFIHKTLTRIERLPGEFQLTWKTASKLPDGITNVYVQMTKPQFQAFADYMYDYMATFWFTGDAMKNQLKAMVAQGATAQQIMAFDHTQGW